MIVLLLPEVEQAAVAAVVVAAAAVVVAASVAVVVSVAVVATRRGTKDGIKGPSGKFFCRPFPRFFQ